MTDAPERIWAAPNPTWADAVAGDWPSPANPHDTEYVRASLPATDAQAMANPKVQALVMEVKSAIVCLDAGVLDDFARLRLEEALAALEAPMRCAECDCKNGGADCNWITTPDIPVKMISRADTATPVPAVPTVKPLVWHKSAHWTTDDDGGPREGVKRPLHCWRASKYEIIRQDHPDGLFILRGGTPKGGCIVLPYLEAAKAAAQADYEARILSAIAKAPADPMADPRVVALVEALAHYACDCGDMCEPINGTCGDTARAALSALEADT